MREPFDSVLRILCAVLGILVVAQSIRSLSHLDPLGDVRIPEVPSWPPKVPSAMTNAATSAGVASGAGTTPMGPGGGTASPSPEVASRVDQITQSGLLGPVIRPPPMALLGIIGKDVLLRAPNGQSGLLREGGELGGVQLLRIGTNRVLVRENGQEKELLIFEGLGGESLLKK